MELDKMNKTLLSKILAISIILLLIGVSVSSATINVIIKNLIDDNQPPNPPDVCGPTQFPVGQYITFTFNAVDPDGDNVSYYIDWGDGTSDGWTSYRPSGVDLTFAHMWEEKPLYIRAKAKDYPHEAESNWSYWYRGRSRNLEYNSKEDCGCGEVSKSNLISVERLLNKVEVYSKLLMVLSKYNPELIENYEALSNMISTFKTLDLKDLICDILEPIYDAMLDIHFHLLELFQKYHENGNEFMAKILAKLISLFLIMGVIMENLLSRLDC